MLCISTHAVTLRSNPNCAPGACGALLDEGAHGLRRTQAPHSALMGPGLPHCSARSETFLAHPCQCTTHDVACTRPPPSMHALGTAVCTARALRKGTPSAAPIMASRQPPASCHKPTIGQQTEVGVVLLGGAWTKAVLIHALRCDVHWLVDAWCAISSKHTCQSTRCSYHHTICALSGSRRASPSRAVP